MKTHPRSVTLLLVVLILPLGSASLAATDELLPDWPQWRGPNRDAISAETGLLNEWPEGGPRVLWRVPVGPGFSSVSVSGDKLYTLWDEGGKQYLFALEAATGKELWRHELGSAFTHNYGDGPRSTPLIDGKRVFAIGTQGRLLAANKDTGERVWQVDLVRKYGARLPTYGYSSSPLAVGDRLVVEAGGEDAAYLALDKTTGELAWKAGSDAPAYSSPIRVTIGGLDQIVFWSAHGLHSVSSAAGEMLWEYHWENFCPVSGAPLNTGTPLFLAPDRLYIASGSGAAMIRVSRENDSFRAESVWESEAMRSDVNTPLLLDGHIYGFDRGTLKSLDAATGEAGWRARGFQRGSLIAADGRLIVLGESGNLALVDADPSAFVQRSTANVLDGRNWTTPALASGKLYLRNHKELVCLDLKR